jgi:cytochrome c553
VRRLALSIVVLLLAMGLSGAASLVAAEPCSSLESSAADSDCPPACVTCGCCHQASDVTVTLPALSPIARLRPRLEVMPTTSDREPRDILHVPRTA